MLGYVTLGSNDFDRAVAFYDALLEPFGGKRLMGSDRMAMFGKDMSGPMLAVCKPYDEQPATVGNGVMVALQMSGPEEVAKLHAKALELGASDEGAPRAPR